MRLSWEDAERLLNKFKKNQKDFHSGGRPVNSGYLYKLRNIGIVFFILFILISIVVAYVSEYGKPWEVMVMQNKLGENAGYEEEIYEGGRRYLLMPFKQDMHHFDTRIKFVDILTDAKQNNDGTYTITPGTGVETPVTDGSKVYSDITFAYRVFAKPEYDEKGKLIHGGANELRKKAGINTSNWEKVLKQDVNDRCKRALGSLKTDDYYNSKLRETKVKLAKGYLNNGWTDNDGVHYEGWNTYGIQIVDVLDRAYYYMPVIDKAIAAKNLQIQEEKYNAAQETKSINDALVAKAEAEGDAIIATMRANGESQKKVILSRADLYYRTKVANGDLAVKKADAEAQKLVADSLMDSGSDIYIAKELAPLAKNLKGGVVTGMDPFNMSQWLTRFTGKKSN